MVSLSQRHSKVWQALLQGDDRPCAIAHGQVDDGAWLKPVHHAFRQACGHFVEENGFQIRVRLREARLLAQRAKRLRVWEREVKTGGSVTYKSSWYCPSSYMKCEVGTIIHGCLPHPRILSLIVVILSL